MNKISFCPECGSKISKVDQRFCSMCGYSFQESDLESYNDNQENTINDAKTQYNELLRENTLIKEDESKKTIQYAEFGDRFVAFLIDSVIFSALASLIGLSFTGGFRVQLHNFIVPFLYLWAMESYNNGQTLGKMAMHLVTVDRNTMKPIEPGQAALHIIGKVLFLPLDVILGFIINDDSEQNKGQYRITQQFSKTTVIKA
jgi:uncharacterized RDD family membrane protein YckC/ribosomal protein L37E